MVRKSSNPQRPARVPPSSVAEAEVEACAKKICRQWRNPATSTLQSTYQKEIKGLQDMRSSWLLRWFLLAVKTCENKKKKLDRKRFECEKSVGHQFEGIWGWRPHPSFQGYPKKKLPALKRSPRALAESSACRSSSQCKKGHVEAYHLNLHGHIACVFVHIYIYTSILEAIDFMAMFCVYSQIYVYMYRYKYVYVYVYINIYNTCIDRKYITIFFYMCIDIYVHVCIHLCICKNYMYWYMYIHI